MRNLPRGILGGLILVLGCLLGAPAARAQAAAACDPSGGLSFVCGLDNPEDLKEIPGTRWLIASGMKAGAGLKLVDTQARTALAWSAGPHFRARPDRRAYPACQAPMEHARFAAHGLSLRPAGGGRYRLYVVAHEGREGVEVFEVDARPAVPTLTWVGCLPAPENIRLNSVAAFSDGTVLITGTPPRERFVVGAQGAVYQWSPGQPAFRALPGTELVAINGIETSRDERRFYVVALMERSIVQFERGDRPRVLGRSAPAEFHPDNIGWSGDRLIIAGSRDDEPACGGRRSFTPPISHCVRGYVVAEVAPDTLAVTTLAYGEPNPAYGGVSAAALVGDEVWIGSYRADRLAYRRLPGSRPR